MQIYTNTNNKTTIQDIPDDVVHYMMHNCSDIPTFWVFQRTCSYYYNVLTNNALTRIENFTKTHPLDFKLRLPLSMLHLSAYKDATTPSTNGLLRTVDVATFSHFSPQELVDELPEMDFRYKRLQSIYDELIQGLSVFMPSLRSFGRKLQKHLIEGIKGFPKNFLIAISLVIFWEIFTPYSHCKNEAAPCTYWEATKNTQEYLLFVFNYWKNLPILMIKEFFKSNLQFGIAIALGFSLVRIFTQIPQFRTAATATLDSLAKDLGY